MVSLATLTAVAYIVMLVSKLMPSVMFLDFDFKDVVICIGGFTFGPLAAALIAILVPFIEMITVSHTGPIGFVMNVLATASFCCTASYVYKKKHTKAGAVLGLGLGT
ncbi:MAG: ECF transporter S component, partial [Lawsonibacter sp.]|nr:ECF transporter S component [Lawsonibacter sp.]